MLATIGAFVLAVGFLLFVINVFYAIRAGQVADANPWGGDSLEWTLPSPPGFVLYPTMPVVTSRHPLWETDRVADPQLTRLVELLDHRPTDWRATLLVDVVTGQPQAIARLATPSFTPPWAS
jgi:cytochrome c oxidase subunit I+III